MGYVYRLETASGSGVFDSGAASWAQGYARQHGEKNPYEHPAPCFDKRLYPKWKKLSAPHQWYFGLADLAQYYTWFESEGQRQVLADEGVQLNVWEATDQYMIVGDHQAVFRRSKATLIATLHPATLCHLPLNDKLASDICARSEAKSIPGITELVPPYTKEAA